MADNTADGKIRQALETMASVRADLGRVWGLLREAGVPYVGKLTEGADELIGHVMSLAKKVSFDEDDAVFDDRPTRPVERVA
jgi:hypothetical protein